MDFQPYFFPPIHSEKNRWISKGPTLEDDQPLRGLAGWEVELSHQKKQPLPMNIYIYIHIYTYIYTYIYIHIYIHV